MGNAHLTLRMVRADGVRSSAVLICRDVESADRVLIGRILRLRGRFALRSGHCAQDDNTVTGRLALVRERACRI